MGSVKRFNISRLYHQYKLQYFFETGTWKGDGLAYAAKTPFKKLYSSEIIESIAKEAERRFKADKRITIINDASTSALKSYLDQIKGSCMFWLDAHFPGAEEGLQEYNQVKDENIKLPLQAELEIIASRQDRFKDVILIDDLRIYEEGAFQSGNMPDHILRPANRSIDFVYNLFGNTHNVAKSYRNEGYLYLLPRTNPEPLSTTQRIYFKLLDQWKKKII
jgi:hypothetical protein